MPEESQNRRRGHADVCGAVLLSECVAGGHRHGENKEVVEYCELLGLSNHAVIRLENIESPPCR